LQEFFLIKALQSRKWSLAAARIFGAAALIFFSCAAVFFGFDFDDGRFWLFVAVVAISLFGDYVTSFLLTLVAVGCLAFFFAKPTFSFRIEQQEDILSLVAFLVSSVVVTSITARIHRISQEELVQTRAKLARFGRVAIVGELTASIAHELNQPLAGLVTSGDACRRWLSNQPPNIDRANQSLDRMIRDADRARMVVDRVRGLVKNSPPEKYAVNLNEAVWEVILITRGDAERNQIKLEFQFAEELAVVWADRVQLQQVCLNLIVNAIEALKSVQNAPRKLGIRTERDLKDGVIVTVTDTGLGIDPKHLEDVFTAFFTTKQGGMGIGLAISRTIVEAHGGRLWASANMPHGAKFQFTMPLYCE
jgi:C4-dicarboxylate-specific signal transduction histidine kinase